MLKISKSKGEPRDPWLPLTSLQTSMGMSELQAHHCMKPE